MDTIGICGSRVIRADVIRYYDNQAELSTRPEENVKIITMFTLHFTDTNAVRYDTTVYKTVDGQCACASICSGLSDPP